MQARQAQCSVGSVGGLKFYRPEGSGSSAFRFKGFSSLKAPAGAFFLRRKNCFIPRHDLALLALALIRD